MSENYIVINGKKADLTQEQLEALGIEVKKEDPFEKVTEGERYYFINSWGGTAKTSMHENDNSNLRWHVANYCTDEALLLQQAYRETLNRLLWRFSMEHDGDQIDWDNHDMSKYFIAFAHDMKCWVVDDSFKMTQIVGPVAFFKREIARQAINEIAIPFMEAHPDFKL